MSYPPDYSELYVVSDIHLGGRRDAQDNFQIFNRGERLGNLIRHITEFYREIDQAGARPVSIGGDHSITGGILQAMGGPGSHIAGGEKVSSVTLKISAVASRLPFFRLESVACTP